MDLAETQAFVSAKTIRIQPILCPSLCPHASYYILYIVISLYVLGIQLPYEISQVSYSLCCFPNIPLIFLAGKLNFIPEIPYPI